MNIGATSGMRIAALLFFLLIGGSSIFAQTCTIVDTDGNAGTLTTVLWLDAVCSQTGLPPINGDNITVPVGVKLSVNNAGGIPVAPTPFFVGNFIVNGELAFSKNGALLNGNITVENGGTLILNKKLDMGSAAGCGYRLVVKSLGEVDLTGGGAADRLSICGFAIAQSGGGCGPFPTGPLPFCEPAGGFPSPIGLDQTGFNATLPIRLAYFNANLVESGVSLTWATEKEENFDHFELERASSNLKFSPITSVPGAGYNTESRQEYTWLDSNPFAGENYYRLKAVDLDGSFEYFSIASASATGNRRFSIFPNPSKENFVNYSVNFDYSSNDKIVVMDNMGNVLQQTPVSSIEGKLNFGETINPGLYFVQYVSNGFRQTVRVTIR